MAVTQPRDVRMRGFSRRATVEEALAWINGLATPLASELIPLAMAGGRVLAEEIISEVDVPGFDRAMMDGFAVRAGDTSGASSYNRLTLSIIGQVLPGGSYAGRVGGGEAVEIMTGSPLPPGADAVLAAEKVELDGDRILALDEVGPGRNIGRVGEDILVGTTVLRSGRQLRAQDLGVLASIGVDQVPVVRRPRLRIVITGNELLPAGSTPVGHRIVDANGPMLDCLVSRDGGISYNPGIVPDTPEAVLEALREPVDIVVVSGGTSVGQEDHAPVLLGEHGELAIHGIAMRPSSPTGMGRMNGRLVFLLPGNPVSCLSMGCSTSESNLWAR